MRHRLPLAALFLARIVSGAVVMDRIAVIVGNRAIKTSDIDRELRVSSFLNHQPLDEGPAAMRKAAERLIDQEVMRQELRNGQYGVPTDKEVSDFLAQLKRDRFSGSDSRLQIELARYHLTAEQLRRHLLWQLTVLRFIDQRFRSGVLVSDEDAAAYYRDHQAELQKAYPGANSLEAVEPKIRETITGERINQAFEEWLAETRAETRIEYRQRAFGVGTRQ
jgi:peptidyl-prolyl cis-trans isomerase SurA